MSTHLNNSGSSILEDLFGPKLPPKPRKKKKENHGDDSGSEDGLDLSLAHDEMDTSVNYARFLTNDALNDITLEGSDGVKVRANRSILASKSRVFQRALLSSFHMERNGEYSSVAFDFRGEVLRAVVEFVLTDNTKVLDIRTIKEAKNRRGSFSSLQSTKTAPMPNRVRSAGGMLERITSPFISSSKSVSSRRSGGSRSLHIYSRPQIQTLVSLTRAAKHFQLPTLGTQALDTLSHYMTKSPSSAFAVLEACYHEPNVPKEVEGIALHSLRNFVGPVKAKTVEFLSPPVLESILKDEKLRMDEYQLFRIIKRWSNADADDDPTLIPRTIEERRKLAIHRFIPWIRFECINPNLLSSSTIMNSELVTPQQIMKAFQQQALAAHKFHGVVYQRPRQTTAHWRSSFSDVFTNRYDDEFKQDVLQYPPIQNNSIHKWTVEVEETGDSTWLGICMTQDIAEEDEEDDDEDDDGDKKQETDQNEDPVNCNWVYSNDGEAFYGGKAALGGREIPGYGEGSKVTFVLYLMKDDAAHGTLFASVDDSKYFPLFVNLRRVLKAHEGEGFLPTVSMHTPGRVRLLDIRHLYEWDPELGS